MVFSWKGGINIKSKNITYILIASLILNGLLGFGMFWQWRSRTMMFMQNYMTLTREVKSVSVALDRYIDSGDMRHYQLAQQSLGVANAHVETFHLYLQNQPGDKIYNSLAQLTFPSHLYEREKDIEFLRDYQIAFDKLSEALFVKDGTWTFAFIPRHPVNKEVIYNVLNALEEIYSE